MLNTLQAGKQQWLLNEEKNCHYDSEYNEVQCAGKKCPLCKLNGRVVFSRSEKEGEIFLAEARERIVQVKKTEEFKKKMLELKNLKISCVNDCGIGEGCIG